MRKVVVAGGAGFLGSHLIRAFVEQGDVEVVSVDRTPRKDAFRIRDLLESGKITYVEMDLADKDCINQLSSVMVGANTIYAFAAHSSVKVFDPQRDYLNNMSIIRNILDAMVRSKVQDIVFSSSSTVYGKVDSKVLETAVLAPISYYGASKMAAEALISSYVHMNPLNAMILRFANIVGPDATQGVIFDFIRKLKADPTQLEILGNGKQTKQYLHVNDIVDWLSSIQVEEGFCKYNISTESFIDVVTIADIVCEIMKLNGVIYKYTGGECGWKGDVSYCGLDITKAKTNGWRFNYDSTDAIRFAIYQILNFKNS
jgi:UDP-glucose 4-epimerase